MLRFNILANQTTESRIQLIIVKSNITSSYSRYWLWKSENKKFSGFRVDWDENNSNRTSQNYQNIKSNVTDFNF